MFKWDENTYEFIDVPLEDELTDTEEWEWWDIELNEVIYETNRLG